MSSDITAKLASAQVKQPVSAGEGSGLALAVDLVEKTPALARLFFSEKTADRIVKVVAALSVARLIYSNVSAFVRARRERQQVAESQRQYPYRYTLTFSSGTPAFNMLEAWVASLPLTEEAFAPGEFDIEMAPAGTKMPESIVQRMLEAPDVFNEDDVRNPCSYAMTRKTKKTRTYMFEDRPCMVWSAKEEDSDSTVTLFGPGMVNSPNTFLRPRKTNVTLFCSEEDPQVMDRFLETLSLHWLNIRVARETSEDPFKRGVNIYVSNYHGWEYASNTNANRHVVLPGDLLDKILTDVRKFEEKTEWYESVGIPHRRTYLFEGLPGTGKTTLGIVMANRLKKDIYILSLKNQTDSSLLQRLQSVPPGQIVLLEDIDCAFSNDRLLDGSGTESDDDDKQSDDDKLNTVAEIVNALRRSNPITAAGSSAMLTTSGLLNALDGAASKEGQIIIMTTNHAELLTPALVRPGRVDVRVHFTHATDDQINAISERFLGVDHARKFIAELPAGQKFTMAEIQERLIAEVFKDVQDITLS